MTNNLEKWLELAKNNEIKSKVKNWASTSDIALCFNLIQIPSTNTVVLTVTVMKDGVMKNALEEKVFNKTMNVIEQSLQEVYYRDKNSEDIPEYYVSLYGKISTSWYKKLLNCHRFFFIPCDMLWDTVTEVFKPQNIKFFHGFHIKRITVFVKTLECNCTMKFK